MKQEDTVGIEITIPRDLIILSVQKMLNDIYGIEWIFDVQPDFWDDQRMTFKKVE